MNCLNLKNKKNRLSVIGTAALGVGVSCASVLLPSCSTDVNTVKSAKRPNILIIQCDQLSARATNLYNSDFANMPNIDKLFNQSMRFTNAYTVCPLCMAARASLWTGRYPHETNVVSNVNLVQSLPYPTVGEVFTNAGYNTAHYGKQHDAGTLKGFQINQEWKQIEFEYDLPVNYDSFCDVDTTANMVNYLKNTKNQEKPFLAVADLNNPHNICQFVGENSSLALPDEKLLPDLPANFIVKDWNTRPLPIQFIYRTHPRQQQTYDWDEMRYRFYLYAYSRYISMVDSQVGEILQALEDSGNADNTIVILTADHGEGMAAFGLVTKHIAMYENTTNIPLVVYDPRTENNTIYDDIVVSNLDIFPTICEYANIEKPAGLQGTSLLSKNRPSYVVSEWVSEYFNTISPVRMLVDTKFKYVHCLEGNGEELYDLVNDPLEMRNLAPLKEHITTLNKYRELFAKHIKATNDNYYEVPIVVDPRYRTHLLGKDNKPGSDAINEGRTLYKGRTADNVKTYMDACANTIK